MNLLKTAVFLPAFALVSIPALAQRVVVENCRPLASFSVGGWGNGDRNGGSADAERNTGGLSPVISAAVDFPVTEPWSVRIEMGRSFASTFQNGDNPAGPFVRDSVSLDRLTIGRMKNAQPCGAPFRPYAGFGMGAYRYRFEAEGSTVLRGGINGTAGLDAILSDHQAIGAYIALDAVLGPDRQPVFSEVLLVVRFGMGFSFRF